MEHSRILNAYISRLTLADLEALTERASAATHAGLNLGIRAQIDAQAGLYAAVCQTVENLNAHDKRLISEIIESEMAV